MKKLLIAPFLLASLFSFGGELKANPGSRYELPDPRNNDYLNNQSSNNVWYLINQLVEKEGAQTGPGYIINAEKLYVTPLKGNKANCNRNLIANDTWMEVRWPKLFFPISGPSRKYESYSTCIKGVDSSEAKAYLKIFGKVFEGETMSTAFSSDLRLGSSADHLFFKNLNQCNQKKIIFDNWASRTSTNMFNQNNDYTRRTKFFIRFFSKCFGSN